MWDTWQFPYNIFGVECLIDVTYMIIKPPVNEVEKGVYWYQIVRLSICPSIHRHNPITTLCNSSPIMIKLGSDIPWVKISAEFLQWALNELINNFDLLSPLPLSWVQFLSDHGQTW